MTAAADPGKNALSQSLHWIAVCAAEDIEVEDVRRFDHAGATYALYRTPTGYYASAGYCTHEQAQLADGLVLGEIIECPRHQGRFHIPSGKAGSAPVCLDLKTYPVRLDRGMVYIGLDAG